MFVSSLGKVSTMFFLFIDFEMEQILFGIMLVINHKNQSQFTKLYSIDSNSFQHERK